jgi:hypothetical protein
MHEDGYGASDKEQGLNDLNDLHDRIYSLAEEVDDIFPDLDEKYGFGIVDRLQDMALEVRDKIDELRNPQDYEDAVLEREGL